MNFIEIISFYFLLRMSKIILSFCVPTYNRPKRILKIIGQFESIKSNEIELVIGDDNPRSKIVKQKFGNLNIVYFQNRKNLGMDANLLKIINRAHGEFIFILMDDDDIELENIPWVLKTLKSGRCLTHLGGSIGDNRPNHTNLYFKPKYGDEFFKKGYITLFKLIFHFHHASGIILKKSALNLKQALKYCGFLWIQQVLISQSILNGDVLLTTKALANIGEKEYKSGHLNTINPIHPFKYRSQIIFDIFKGKKYKIIRKALLNYEKIMLRNYLLEIKSIKTLIEAIGIIITMKKKSKSIKFWSFLFLNLLYKREYDSKMLANY